MAGDDTRDEGLDSWDDAEAGEQSSLDANRGVEQPEAEQSDALVSGWLADGDEGEAEAAPLGVFVPEDEPDAAGVSPPVGAAEPADAGIEMGASNVFGADDVTAAEFDFDPVADEGLAAPVERSEVDGAVGDDAWPGLEDEPFAGDDHSDRQVFGIVGESADETTGRVADAFDAGSDGGDGVGEPPFVTVLPEPDAVEHRPAPTRGRGRLVGVILGGLLAIPLALGILIWGLRQDPLNVVKHVPDSVAFLFPAELRAAGGTGSPAPVVAVDALKLDDVVASGVVEPALPDEAATTAATDGGSGEPPGDGAAAEPTDPVAAVSPGDVGREDPGAQPDADTVEPSAAPEPLDAPVAAADPSGPAEAGLPDDSTLAAITPAPGLPPDVGQAQIPVVAAEPRSDESFTEPAAPEPAPLDIAPLEESAVAARAAFAAVEAFEREPVGGGDPSILERKRTVLLVEWYRRLAAMAEAYADVEKIAADSGRSLPGPPEAVLGVQEVIVAEPARLDQLARLARNWLAYPGRQASGIVAPASLAGTRRIGPYWCSTVGLAEAGGRTRDLTVISRTEPAAAPGDVVLVTGLIVDGDVVWASDVRPATPRGDSAGDSARATAAEPATEPAATDPFSASEP